MEDPFAPSLGDLEHAYRQHDPRLAGHQRAEAVVVTSEGITVLCTRSSQGEGESTWLAQLNDDGTDRWAKTMAPELGTGRALVDLVDGSFVVVGDIRRSEIEYEAVAFRLAPDGEVITKGTFGPRGVTGLTAATRLVGGSIVGGGTARWHGWLIEADNTLRASSEFLLEDMDDVVGVASREGGGFAVAAARATSTTQLGMTSVLAFAADREVEWRTDLPLQGHGEPAALVAVPGGDLAMVGHRSVGASRAAGLWVVRMSAATGNVLWEQDLGAMGEDRRGRAIAALADGGVIIVGDASYQGRRSLRAVRLSADGDVLWKRSFEGERLDIAHGLAATDDGAVVLVGSTTTEDADRTAACVLRLGSDGSPVWDRVLDVAG